MSSFTGLEVVDGALSIEASNDLAPLIRGTWLPRSPGPATGVAVTSASIRVVAEAAAPAVRPSGPPTLRLGSARLWIQGDPESGVMVGTCGCRGTLSLADLRAEVTIPRDPGPGEASDLYSMLTIASALLLGRTGRVLIHAAAVVGPDGKAWLLAGDARSGKSTTSANLIGRGWNYLSDDQVTLRSENGVLAVEGMLRPFHLDEGWRGARPTHRRLTIDSTTIGPGRFVPLAPLGGLLFPRVSPQRPTTLEAMSPGEAVAALVRQSPWLLADRLAAAATLGLLRTAAEGRRFGLLLGLDTFGNGALLERNLQPAWSTPAFFAARLASRASGQATASASA